MPISTMVEVVAKALAERGGHDWDDMPLKSMSAMQESRDWYYDRAKVALTSLPRSLANPHTMGDIVECVAKAMWDSFIEPGGRGRTLSVWEVAPERMWCITAARACVDTVFNAIAEAAKCE